jgi:hypothetical protein
VNSLPLLFFLSPRLSMTQPRHRAVQRQRPRPSKPFSCPFLASSPATWPSTRSAFWSFAGLLAPYLALYLSYRLDCRRGQRSGRLFGHFTLSFLTLSYLLIFRTHERADLARLQWLDQDGFMTESNRQEWWELEPDSWLGSVQHNHMTCCNGAARWKC